MLILPLQQTFVRCEKEKSEGCGFSSHQQARGRDGREGSSGDKTGSLGEVSAGELRMRLDAQGWNSRGSSEPQNISGGHWDTRTVVRLDGLTKGRRDGGRERSPRPEVVQQPEVGQTSRKQQRDGEVGNEPGGNPGEQDPQNQEKGRGNEQH